VGGDVWQVHRPGWRRAAFGPLILAYGGVWMGGTVHRAENAPGVAFWFLDLSQIPSNSFFPYPRPARPGGSGMAVGLLGPP
jgi:hypothetical protein